MGINNGAFFSAPFFLFTIYQQATRPPDHFLKDCSYNLHFSGGEGGIRTLDSDLSE